MAVGALGVLAVVGTLNADDGPPAGNRQTLIRLLGDPSWDVREGAQRDLAVQGLEALPDLEAAVAGEGLDSEIEWRLLAIIRQVRWQLPEAVSKGLRDMFSGYPDLPPDERDDLVRALEKRGQAAAVPLTRVVQFDPEPALRIMAARALLALPPVKARDTALLDGLKTLDSTAESTGLIAQVLHRLGRDEEAREAITQALELNGQRPGLQRLHAEVLEGVGVLAGALEVLREIIAESPDDLDAQLDLARVLAGLGNEVEVRQRFKVIRQRLSESDAVGPYVELASRMSSLGYQDEAQVTIRLAMDRFPFEPGLHRLLGDIQRDLQLPGEALLSYRIELGYLDPKGKAAQELGDRIRAVLSDQGLEALAGESAGFLEALQQDRMDPALHATLSERLAIRGLVDVALEQARLAALLSPRDLTRRLVVADRLRASGQVAEARRLAEELSGKIRGREARRKLRTLQARLREHEDGGGLVGSAAVSLNTWTWRSGMEADLEDPLPSGPVAVSCDPVPIPGADGGDPMVAVFLAGSAEVIGLDLRRGQRRLRFRPPEPDRQGARPHEEVVLSPAGLASAGDGSLLAFYNRTIREADRPNSSASPGGLAVYRVCVEDGSVEWASVIPGSVATSLVVDPAATLVVWLSAPSPGIARLSVAPLGGGREPWSHRWKGLALGHPQIRNGVAMVATGRGILRVTLAEGEVLKALESNLEIVPATGLQVDQQGRLAFRTKDHGVAIFNPDSGEVRKLLDLPVPVAGGMAISPDRVFVADRGGEVAAYDLSPDGPAAGEGEASWLLSLERTAWRSLMLRGGCLLGLSGAVDAYRGERSQVVLLDPHQGRLLGRREVLRPATWGAVGEGTVVVASGHVASRAGFQVLGLKVGEGVAAELDVAAELSDIGWELQARGEPAAAAVTLERLLLYPDQRSSEVLGRLGRLYHELELHGKAAMVVEEALESATNEQRGTLESLLQEIEAARSGS